MMWESDMNHSILIIGMPGVGKSTLAVIAATALGWPLLDLDRTLARRFNMSVVDYIRLHGAEDFHRLEHDLLVNVISPIPPKDDAAARSAQRYVVACGGGICDREDNRQLIKAFSQSGGKVIHIHRDKQTVVPELRASTSIVFGMDESRVRELWHIRTPYYNEVASHTYINISVDGADGQDGHAYPPSQLVLKPVERDFLCFLRHVLGHLPEHCIDHRHRSYATMIQLPRPYLLPPEVLADATTGASVIELYLDCLAGFSGFSPPPTPGLSTTAADHLTAALGVAYLRRHSRLPLICNLKSSLFGRTTYYDENREAAYVNRILDAFRFGVDYLAIDANISPDSLAFIRAAKPKSLRLLYCLYLDDSTCTPNTISRLYASAVESGADMVRIEIEHAQPASYMSLSSVLLQLGQADKPLSILAGGLHSRMSVLVNWNFTPISHGALSDVLTHSHISYREAQAILYSSGINVQRNIILPAITSTNDNETIFRDPRYIQEALSTLDLPISYSALDDESWLSDSLSCGALISGGTTGIQPRQVSPAASYVGRYTICRADPKLYDNLLPAAMANAISANLSPVNAPNVMSRALLFRLHGHMVREAIWALHLLGFGHIYIHNCSFGDVENNPDCHGLTIEEWDGRNGLSTSNLTVIIAMVLEDSKASKIDRQVLWHAAACPSGGVILDLSRNITERTNGFQAEWSLGRKGWAAVKENQLQVCLAELELKLLTGHNLPRLGFR